MVNNRYLPLFIIILIVSISMDSYAEKESITREISETPSRCEIRGWEILGISISPDGKHIACVGENEEGEEAVFIDGKQRNRHDEILKYFIFSPDGNRLSYLARDGNKKFIVVDGKEGKNYESLGSLIFSPNSKHWAHFAMVGSRKFIVVDGKEGKKYDDTMVRLVFSPDGTRLAYLATTDKKEFVVVDGKEGKKYNKIKADTLIIRPDNKHVAYVVKEGDKEFTVVDGKEGKPYNSIGALIYSPDSRYLTYAAQSNNQAFIVVNEEEKKQYIVVDAPVFSLDSKRLAYSALMSKKMFVVVDGKGSTQYDFIESIIFSPDSKHVAYIAYVGGKQFVVIDEKEGKQYKEILKSKKYLQGTEIMEGMLVFSPDSKHVAYTAVEGNKEFVVVDGEEGNPYQYILSGRDMFDSLGRLHYFGIRNSIEDNSHGTTVLYLVEEKIKESRQGGVESTRGH